MKNLPVQTLEFEGIKDNLKSFLKGNPAYNDFNFEGSGISTLLNILSYNTHYIGYFVKMLLDEAFVDSAHTRSAMLSHAKRTGYIPKGKRAASAGVTLKINTTLAEEPASHYLNVPRGSTFVSANNTQDTRVFTVVDGSTIYKRSVSGSNVTYTSDPIEIYEGEIRSWKFKVDATVLNQRFIIRDNDIDIDTIRVRVKENDLAVNFREYHLASGISDIGPTSEVFFVTTDENGYYQVFFGNGVFGVQPQNDNLIEVTYIGTNGETGNGAKTFTFNPSGALAAFNNFEVVTLSNSSGGREAETTEELKFSVPHHFRRQSRLVTADDYRSILLGEFRNIDSMNVWGGEENTRRDYGKVYVSIKPRNSERLTALAREQIREQFVKKMGVVGSDVVFVDPDFIEVDLTIFAKIDLRKTSKSLPEMITQISDRIQEYNSTQLSKFDSILSDIGLLNFVRNSDESITSIYSNKIIGKNYLHLHGTTASQIVSFGNPIVPGSLNSTSVVLVGSTYSIKDDMQGALSLVDSSGKKYMAVGTVDYDKGTFTYMLPAAARIADFELSTYGRVYFTAAPTRPDITTYLNNIVRISKIKVVAG